MVIAKDAQALTVERRVSRAAAQPEFVLFRLEDRPKQHIRGVLQSDG
jgi:hypothetical protein